jgi:hypothetical protein
MANTSPTLRVSELDFFTIKENLKTFLRSQDTFTDYDFDGSGMSILLDVLAYNTFYSGFYQNMIANESYLDTAQVRNNILSLAKSICYVPTSSIGATSIINVVVTPSEVEDQTSNVLTLDKYTRLLAHDIDGVNYPFVTVTSNTATKIGGSFTFSNTVIKQGEVVTLQFLAEATNTTRRYQIPSANVDTTTISVTVQASASNTYTEVYNLADDLTEISDASLVYFIEEDNDLKYTVYFGDDVLGKRPVDGSVIIITYLDNVGTAANAIKYFNFVEPIGTYNDNIIVTVNQSSYGGTNKETMDKIRFRAPYFYTAQNRAVTVNDYETIITKDYNNIDAVSVWGGEDNDPVVYGKVYMSLKTKKYYSLTNLEKEHIKNTLIENRNVVTIIPEIVDPDYVFILISGKVYYNPSKTSKTADEINTLVKAAVLDYNERELNTFKSTFRKSHLQKYIESCDPSITGSDLIIYLQKRVLLTTNQSKNYTINFNMSMRKGDFIEKLYTSPAITVLDSGYNFREVFIEEIPEAFTGVDSISVINPGINYTTTPTITIEGDGMGATAKAILSGTKIKSIEILTKGTNYSRATVVIDGDGSEAVASAVLEARNGVLRSYYYKTNGEKVVVNDAAGTIDYNTGKVFINSLLPYSVSSSPFYDDNFITVNAVPAGDIILPVRNRILAIDENNYESLQVQVIADS